MPNRLKLFFHQHIVPHRLLSWITHLLMHAKRFPFRDSLVSFMIRRHSVNVEEALYPDYTDRNIHPTINSFFVRALKPEARPIVAGDDKLCSPADGTVSQIGVINDGKIFQAKGHSFSLLELLGGSAEHAQAFSNGHFATIYLSPSDYHRVHMPYAGTLQQMIHIPGKLLSVAPFLIDNVPDLFARNERVVSLFETSIGPMAVVLVGAINVGSIETVWAGEVTPPSRTDVSSKTYTGTDALTLQKGDEMGRFNMGSTVIILFAQDAVLWSKTLTADDKIKMGAEIGTVGQA